MPMDRTESDLCQYLIKGRQQLISCVNVLNGNKRIEMNNFFWMVCDKPGLIFEKKYHHDFQDKCKCATRADICSIVVFACSTSTS